MHNKHRHSTHVVLRRPDGSIRLILPIANSAVLRGLIDMYYPSRMLGKLFHIALKTVMPIQARLGWCQDAGNVDIWCPFLSQVLSKVIGAKPEHVGALVSLPGSNSKLTLKIMNESGQALAYGRIGYIEDSMQMISREGSLLRRLDKMPIRNQVPRLIDEGSLGMNQAYFLIETAGPNIKAGVQLTSIHFEFLSDLATGVTTKWSVLIDSLESDVSSIINIPIAAEIVGNAFIYLRNCDIQDISCVIEHGDFTPWNLRITSNGDLFVLDWEHSRLDGLPWMDVLHFLFRYHWLVKRDSPNIIINRMQHIFDNATSYRFNSNISLRQKNSYILLFLLRLLISKRYEEKGIIEMIISISFFLKLSYE